MNTISPCPITKNRKPRNQFAFLPEADRQLILNLCSQHPYDDVVDLLRKSRSEGGLDLRTSAAALCRYFTAYQPDERAVLAQIAAAANIRHEQDSNAFLGAIRATVQARVLENLRSGRALADMHQDFKLLRTAESLYLADAKFRAENPKAARANYKDHVRLCAENSDADFVPADESTDEISGHLSALERDILAERKRQQETEAILAKTAIYPKTPVIPHIPPNSTKPVPPTPTISNPPPKPHIAPPKIGRNDPCPCGSGRKSKKCCHR